MTKIFSEEIYTVDSRKYTVQIFPQETKFDIYFEDEKREIRGHFQEINKENITQSTISKIREAVLLKKGKK